MIWSAHKARSPAGNSCSPAISIWRFRGGGRFGSELMLLGWPQVPFETLPQPHPDCRIGFPCPAARTARNYSVFAAELRCFGGDGVINPDKTRHDTSQAVTTLRKNISGTWSNMSILRDCECCVACSTPGTGVHEDTCHA